MTNNNKKNDEKKHLVLTFCLLLLTKIVKSGDTHIYVEDHEDVQGSIFCFGQMLDI